MLSKLEEERKELKKNIDEEESNLELLKQRICSITDDSISIDWQDLFNHLYQKREELIEENKKVKAEILAGICLSQVINELKNQEDENIINSLASQSLSEPIQTMTHRYTGVELDDEEIVVFNPKQRFPLSKMSTGAQEQILLALRLGIAAYTLGDQRMFLILDDAFQHSDWERREWLVTKMADLANLGWQIIYFTMDEHIKKLFEIRIKPVFNDRFQLFELN